MTENEKPKPRRSGEMVLGSARLEAEAERTRGSDLLSPMWRKQAGAMAEQVRGPAPEYMSTTGAGGELVPASILGENSRALEFADTVQRPDYVTVDASRDRLELANAAGALEMGLDVAETIGAENSLEKMLAHQLAAAHRSTMKMTALMNRHMESLESISSHQLNMQNPERLKQETCRLGRRGHAHDGDVSTGGAHAPEDANGRASGGGCAARHRHRWRSGRRGRASDASREGASPQGETLEK
jgi:hypothetical protein